MTLNSSQQHNRTDHNVLGQCHQSHAHVASDCTANEVLRAQAGTLRFTEGLQCVLVKIGDCNPGCKLQHTSQ